MRLNKFIISTCMLLLASNAMAQDSTSIDSQESDAYKHYVEMRRRHWAQLIPNQIVVQNAGNMGLLSAGIGWRYGHQHWETHWLVGFIPKHQSTRTKLTMTLKENFIPWNLRLTEPQGASTDFMKRGWTLSPLTASMEKTAQSLSEEILPVYVDQISLQLSLGATHIVGDTQRET